MRLIWDVLLSLEDSHMDEIFTILKKKKDILVFAGVTREIAVATAIGRINTILGSTYDHSDTLLNYFYGNQSIQTTILRLTVDKTPIRREDLPVLQDRFIFKRSNGRIRIFTEVCCKESLQDAGNFFGKIFTRYQYDQQYKNLKPTIPSSSTIMRILKSKNDGESWRELVEQVLVK